MKLSETDKRFRDASTVLPPVKRLRWVACEECGGSGEIIRRDPIGPYDDPGAAEYGEICAACEGTGRDCTDQK